MSFQERSKKQRLEAKKVEPDKINEEIPVGSAVSILGVSKFENAFWRLVETRVIRPTAETGATLSPTRFVSARDIENCYIIYKRYSEFKSEHPSQKDFPVDFFNDPDIYRKSTRSKYLMGEEWEEIAERARKKLVFVEVFPKDR